MVPTQNPAAAPLAKQIIVPVLALALLLPASALAGECETAFAVSAQAERELSHAGLQSQLTCGGWHARLAAHAAARPHSRETGPWSFSIDGPRGLLTAGRQFLPARSSFLAESWSLLEEPLRKKGTMFAGIKAPGITAGGFGLEGSKSAGAFLASKDFFGAFHPETGLGALTFRSDGQFHRFLIDVIRLPDPDRRLTTEGFAGGYFEPFDWRFDIEAERRASWDLARDGSVDPARRGRSGLISFGAAGEHVSAEAGGQDKGRTGLRALRTTALLRAQGQSLGACVSLRGYEKRLYAQSNAAVEQDQGAAFGPALRAGNLEMDVLAEFRRTGPPGAEVRLTWKNRFIAAGLSAFAASARSGATGVHMLRDGMPDRASRRFYSEENAAMVLSLRAKGLYVYASVAKAAAGKSSLYLHGEGQFEL